MMDVATFDSSTVSAFADAAQAVIERDPAPSSVLATVLNQAVNDRPIDGALWLLLRQDGRVLSAAMQTPPNNLFLTPLPDEDRAKAVHHLADALIGIGRELPGVSGSVADARAFATEWSWRTGLDQHVTMNERLYALLDPPTPLVRDVPGAARPATELDLELGVRWLTGYNLEAFAGRAGFDAEQAFRQRLRTGAFLIWEDAGEPVSLAGLHPSIAGSSRIGPVYTPGFRRGRGYGSAVTVAASRLGFAQGSTRCVLYTDLTNPTSNSIYQAIGYRPVQDSAMIAFR